MLVLAVVAVLAVVLGHDDGSKAAITASLVSTKATIEDAMAPVRSASRLGPLRKAGRRAARQVAALESPGADLTNQKNRKRADPAKALVASERAYLKALGGLKRLTVERVGEGSLASWRQIEAEIRTAAEDVVTASAAVSASDIEEPSGGVGFTKAELDETLSPVQEMVTTGNRRIKKWRLQRKAYRDARAAALRRAVPVVDYRKDVDAALDDFASDRREVSAWARNAAGYKRSDGHRLRGQVAGFVNERGRTIDELRNVLELAPSTLPVSVRRAHEAFGSPVSKSLEGLGQAEAAISRFEGDSEKRFSNLTVLAEWDEFERLSRSVDEDMVKVRGRWASAVRSEIGRIQTSIGVSKPVYPKL